MSPDKKERDKIIARVRALLAMTTENGCTEAEAMIAAGHAAKLLEQHDLAIADVEAFKSEPVGKETKEYRKSARSKEMHPSAKYAAVAVAHFFDCRVWHNAGAISFFGMKDDVGLAHDLLKLLQGAFDRELRGFKASGMVADGPGVVAQSNSFCAGMGARIGERLDHLKALRTAAVKAKGTDLVVIKTYLVSEAFAKAFGPNFLKQRGRRFDPSSDAAYAAGYQAGDRVGLGQKELAKPHFDSRTRRQRVQDVYAEYRAILREQQHHHAALAGQRASNAATPSIAIKAPRPPLRDALRVDLLGWRDFLMGQAIFAFLSGFVLVSYRYVVVDGVDLHDKYGQISGHGFVVVVLGALIWLCVASTLRTMIYPSDEDLPRNPLTLVAFLIGTGAGTCVIVYRRILALFRPTNRPHF